MSTTTLPRPPRVPRWARVTLAVLGVVLVVAGAAAAWFVSMLVGLVEDVAASDRVQPDDARVVAAQEVAERDLSAELAGLTLGRSDEVLARTSVSDCKEGQHNWKVDEDYDLYCGQGSAVLLRGEPERFRDEAIALHERLLAQGWTPTPSHLDGETELRGIPAAVAVRWDGKVGATPATVSGAGYARGGTRLVVGWLDAGGRLTPGHPFSAAAWDVPRRVDVGNDHLGTAVPAGSYGVGLLLSTEYFRE